MREPINIWRAVGRPEYLLRPSQLWRRFRRKSICARSQVRLAWGLPIDVDPVSRVGSDIINLGVFERSVPEAIFRLLEPGETAIDAGANVGQNASMMALRAGGGGSVVAFEPAPESWRLLTNNLTRWEPFDLAPITPVRKGLSSREGEARLYPAEDAGGFSLEANPEIPPRIASAAPAIPVGLTSLDAFLPPDLEIGVLKVDVEGHELELFRGATRLLERRLVRDILFEDYHPQPSPVTMLLESYGYRVFWLEPARHKPMLRTIADRIAQGPQCLLADFFATREPERARARFERAGWGCLKVRARLKTG